MKILQLSVENVKRVQAVEITPDGNLVVVGGKNGAGKSSLLDAIMYGLAGGRTIPAVPLRKGQTVGKTEIVLGDDGKPELTVVRTFTGKGTSHLTIKTGEGFTAPTPQKILDDLCGRIAFDPLAFTRQSSKDQADTLRQVVGLDFTEQDRERKRAYDERTVVNRALANLDAQLKGRPLHDDVPAEEISIVELTGQVAGKTEAGKRNHCKRASLSWAEHHVKGHGETVLELEGKLAAARAELAEAVTAEKLARKVVEEDLEDEDVEGLSKQIDAAEEVNAKVRANKFRAGVQDDRDSADTASKQLTADIADIDAAKLGATADADWPVEGLGFGADGVTLNELPFENASQAEQLQVSVAIGVAMHPTLRVQLIRDASLLDDESLEHLATLAAEHDTQLWLERVGEGRECSVVIEDGTVKGETQPCPCEEESDA